MENYAHFRIVAQVVTNEATYSFHWRRPVISVLCVKETVRERLGRTMGELPWVDAALQEGVLMGFWEMDFDPDDELDIVLVRKHHPDAL